MSMPRRALKNQAMEAQIDAVPGLRFYLDTLSRYGQTRWTEIWLALILLGYSLVLLSPTETFSAPAYRVVASLVTEGQAGAFGALVALGRLWMIKKNGSAHYTPVFRAIGCMASAVMWGTLGLGFILAAPPLIGSTVIFPLFALAELHSASRAGADAIPQNSFGVRDFLVRRDERASRGKNLGGS